MRHIVAVITILMLQSCGTNTPPCADKETTNIVKQIFRESLEKNIAIKGQDKSISDQVMAAIQIGISTIRTAEHDEKIGKYSCDAVIEVTLPERVAAFVNEPTFRRIMLSDVTTQAIEVSSDVVKNNINYTSQLTDDKHEHLVELQGHQPIVNFLFILGANGAFNLPDIINPHAKNTDIQSSDAEAEVGARPVGYFYKENESFTPGMYEAIADARIYNDVYEEDVEKNLIIKKGTKISVYSAGYEGGQIPSIDWFELTEGHMCNGNILPWDDLFWVGVLSKNFRRIGDVPALVYDGGKVQNCPQPPA